MFRWRRLRNWFICGHETMAQEQVAIDAFKTQNAKDIPTQVHPLSAEKSAVCYASAPPPSLESYARAVQTPLSDILAKQQRRLEEWDQDLRRREHALVVLRTPKKAAKNWPKIFPVIYHSISLAIPIQHQPLMHFAYWTWKLTTAAYIFNWLLIFIALLTGFQKVSFLEWFLVTITMGCGIPLSFQLTYYPLYKAFEEGEPIDTLCWRFHMTCAILWSFLMILGVPFLGHVSAGLWSVVVAMKTDSDFMGLACFANSIIWTVVLVFETKIVKEARKTELIRELPCKEANVFQGC